VAELLEHARPAKPSTGPVIPDDVYSTLTIVAAGRKDEIEPSPQIDALLRQAAERAVQQAVVGTWREWRWKLCHPAAKLTASDVDPPIDALQFRADGRFEVTWPGGGAYTIGIPHIPVPDYAGRYTLVPAEAAIDLHVTGGLVAPRDFSGNGRFRVAADTLTLENVWLGTRQAKQKPDICELTFVRA